MACVICQESVHTDMCGACRRGLTRCRLAENSELSPYGRPLQLYALFHYRDEARALLHAAKISCAWRALLTIERCFFLDGEVRAAVAWADVILAAPSSLWGRLRGRFDVAGYVGEGLACAWEKSFRPLRGPGFWRWKKLALLSRQERQVRFRFPPHKRRSRADFTSQNILLVDDVVTTGFTMAELSEHFPGNRLRLVAFARA